MKTEEYIIIEKAGNITMNEGVEALTISKLATALALSEEELYPEITTDKDILLLLLKTFEHEITDLIETSANSGESPETALKILFKQLYFLFLQKPYYLSIIFESGLMERETRIKRAYGRIRTLAENYLITLLNAGKESGIFKTKSPSKQLAIYILSGFQLFMKDEQRYNEMILELKAIQTSND